MKTAAAATVLVAMLPLAACSPGLRLEVNNDSPEAVWVTVIDGEQLSSVPADPVYSLHAQVAANRREYWELRSDTSDWSVLIDGRIVVDSGSWSREQPVVSVHVRTDGTVGVNGS
jgi:hypothetical protein